MLKRRANGPLGRATISSIQPHSFHARYWKMNLIWLINNWFGLIEFDLNLNRCHTILLFQRCTSPTAKMDSLYLLLSSPNRNSTVNIFKITGRLKFDYLILFHFDFFCFFVFFFWKEELNIQWDPFDINFFSSLCVIREFTFSAFGRFSPANAAATRRGLPDHDAVRPL